MRPNCMYNRVSDIDIYTNRILAKYKTQDLILFDVDPIDETLKIPIKIGIRKNIFLENITDVFALDLTVIETSQTFSIPDKKVKLTIRFNVNMVVIFDDTIYWPINLPSGASGSNPTFCFMTSFPVEYGLDENLKISDGNFLWSKQVYLSQFNHIVPRNLLNSPSFNSVYSFIQSKQSYEIIGDSICPPSTPSVEMDLSVLADSIDRLGIYQDILVRGILLDDFDA